MTIDEYALLSDDWMCDMTIDECTLISDDWMCDDVTIGKVSSEVFDR